MSNVRLGLREESGKGERTFIDLIASKASSIVLTGSHWTR
jgi:hypothetical protein